MGIFDFFSKGLFFATIEQIEKKIKASKCYNYFSNEDTQLVTEYKNFEITILSSSIAALILDLDLNDIASRKNIQTIYIGKTAGFLRKVINNEVKVYDLDYNSFDDHKKEMMIILKVHALFEKYYEEIKQAFSTSSIYDFWKYESPIYNDATGEYENGEERLYKFLWNIFLAYEGYDFINFELPAISHRVFMELTEDELNMLSEFVKKLAEHKN